MRGRIITVNSVSKSHAMTGWRIGYAAAEEHIIEAKYRVQSQITACPALLANMQQEQS